jgi:hemerythrin
VHDFLWQIRVNDDLIDFKMYDFLRDWMNDHLQRTDKEYALFLFSRGVR